MRRRASRPTICRAEWQKIAEILSDACRGICTLSPVKNIVTVVRPERLHAVKEALFRVGVTGMTLSRVSGHGGEREMVSAFVVSEGEPSVDYPTRGAA